MELIPILSLIVLVATISTFILAVGAYVLYKIRERKGRVASAPAPASIEAELVTPSQSVAGHKEPTRATHTTLVTEQYQPQRVTDTSIFQRSTKATREEARNFAQPMQQTFIGDAPADTKYTRETRYTVERPTRATRSTSSDFASTKKYMRYTTDGYVEPDKDTKKKTNKEDKLRWR